MGFLDNIKRKKWNNQLLEKAEDILHRVFEYEDYQKHLSVKWFDKQGREAKEDFRKLFMQTINRIADSPTPLFEFRKALFFSTKNECINRLLFTTEFSKHREFLLKKINPEDLGFNEEQLAFQSYVYSEAECIALRLLQVSVFENIDEDNDWWVNYCKIVENNFKHLFEAIIEEHDKRVPEQFNVLMVKASSSLMEQYENKLLGLPTPDFDKEYMD